MRLAAHVAEVPESEDISGGQGHQVCFRSSGPPGVFSEFRITGSVFGVQGYQEGKCAVVPRKLRDQRKVLRPGAPERKICCGAPKTSQSGASAGKLHADTPKGSEMNVKMTEVGHMGRKHSLMPRRMI